MAVFGAEECLVQPPVSAVLIGRKKWKGITDISSSLELTGLRNLR